MKTFQGKTNTLAYFGRVEKRFYPFRAEGKLIYLPYREKDGDVGATTFS